MNTIQRIAKHTGVLLVSQIASYILGFFFIMYTARYLGAGGLVFYRLRLLSPGSLAFLRIWGCVSYRLERWQETKRKQAHQLLLSF